MDTYGNPVSAGMMAGGAARLPGQLGHVQARADEATDAPSPASPVDAALKRIAHRLCRVAEITRSLDSTLASVTQPQPPGAPSKEGTSPSGPTMLLSALAAIEEQIDQRIAALGHLHDRIVL